MEDSGKGESNSSRFQTLISHRYPYVATEVLCSEIWSIVEACVNHSEQLLAPFWDSILSRSTDDLKSRSAMASQFSKINGVFMGKKPAEVQLAIRPI